MKAFVVYSPGDARITEIDRPQVIGPYEVLVKMELCVICNTTDRMIISGQFPYPINYPAVLGHESVGVVIETGAKVRSFKTGDRITRAGYRPDDPQTNMHAAWGGFAEYGIAEDVRALREDGLPHGYAAQAPQVIPPDIPLRDAALFISLGETLSFCSQLGDLQDKRVMITGTGIAGLAIARFAWLGGAKEIIVIGRRESRLELAQQLGATHAWNDKDPAWQGWASGKGTVDIIIEASGNSDAFVKPLSYLKDQGVVAMYGVSDQPYKLPLAASPADFTIRRVAPNEAEVMGDLAPLFREGKIPASLLVTHEWRFEQLDEAFRQIARGDVVKGIVWIGDRSETM